MLPGSQGSSPGVFSRDQHHSLCTEAPPQASGAFHPRNHVAVIFPFSAGSLWLSIRDRPCVFAGSPGAEARIRASGQGNETLGAAGSPGSRRPPLSDHDLPCPAQPGACKDLAKHHAGAPWDQTGTGERAGVGEDETLHDRGRLGLHWGLEGEAKLLKDVGNRRKKTQLNKQNKIMLW